MVCTQIRCTDFNEKQKKKIRLKKMKSKLNIIRVCSKVLLSTGRQVHFVEYLLNSIYIIIVVFKYFFLPFNFNDIFRN